MAHPHPALIELAAGRSLPSRVNDPEQQSGGLDVDAGVPTSAPRTDRSP